MIAHAPNTTSWQISINKKNIIWTKITPLIVYLTTKNQQKKPILIQTRKKNLLVKNLVVNFDWIIEMSKEKTIIVNISAQIFIIYFLESMPKAR